MYSYKQVILAIRTGESESLSENHPTERGKFMKLIVKSANELCIGDMILLESDLPSQDLHERATRLFFGDSKPDNFTGGTFCMVTELSLSGDDVDVHCGNQDRGFSTSYGNEFLVLLRTDGKSWIG